MDRENTLSSLQKLTQPFRKPTSAELYLTNFWNPTVGQLVFSQEEYPGKIFKIVEIDKKHPEQAIVRVDKKPTVIYLQDWCWSPQVKDMDNILTNLGLRILDDCVMKGKFINARPQTPEDYVNVIREVRKYGTRIESYFQDKKEVKKEKEYLALR